MGSGTPDRPGSIRAVDAIALQIEADPSRPDRVVFSSRNDDSVVIVGRVGNSADNSELTGGAWAVLRAHRNLEGRDDHAVVDHGELSVHQADEHNSVSLVALRSRILREGRN